MFFNPAGPVVMHGGLARKNPAGKVFKLTGKETCHGSASRINPYYDDQYPGTLAARLIVGFKVGLVLKYNLSDLISLVKHARKVQCGVENATFTTQKGFYTYTEGEHKGKTVQEPGAQVMVLNVPPAWKSPAKFKKDMTDLAVFLCQRMQQEAVILDFYKDGHQLGATHVIGYSAKAIPGKKPLKSSLK